LKSACQEVYIARLYNDLNIRNSRLNFSINTFIVLRLGVTQ
jgi:hypothetical protein